MPLADIYDPQCLCSGDAAEFADLSEVVNRIEDFLRRTLPSITENFCGWTPARKRRNEKSMAADLGKELNFAATDEAFHFHSEDPESEAANRTLDMGTYPTAHLRVHGYSLSAKGRLYGIEMKRFPTSASTTDGRDQEYVVGDLDVRNSTAKRMTGGIERFKEEVHGKDLERAAMIAFIQHKDAPYWFQSVNKWITDLIAWPLISHKARWAEQDKLVVCPPLGPRVTEFTSTHGRPSSVDLKLRHFWLDVILPTS